MLGSRSILIKVYFNQVLIVSKSNKIVILGGGESGCGAALLGKAKGFEIFVSDNNLIQEKYKNILLDNEICFEEGKHSEELMNDVSVVIKSPTIPEDAPIVQLFHRKKVKIISEIEFAYAHSRVKLIAVTGSNGKTTTSSLIYHILKSAGLNVKLVGNIGHSYAKEVIADSADIYVIEVSSFQLDNTYSFKPDIAIILNISADHLDRYNNDFKAYAKSKFRLIQNMTNKDCFIYHQLDNCINDEIVKRNILPIKLPININGVYGNGGFVCNTKLISKYNELYFEIEERDVPIKGPHNVINTLCAILVCQILNLENRYTYEGIKTFKAIPHRMEKVRIVNEVTFINDSKATNVEAVSCALKSFDRPVILIMGGIDKGNDYSVIEELILQKVKLLILLGKDNTKLEMLFKKTRVPFISTDSMKIAVTEAANNSEPNDIVLLSPACASFDIFKNYEDRGNQFKEYVNNLL